VSENREISNQITRDIEQQRDRELRQERVEEDYVFLLSHAREKF